MPTLFMREGTGDEVVGIGWMTRIERKGTDYHFQYTVDPDIPLMTNRDVYDLASELQMDSFEFSRNHWAVKDVDLSQVLYRAKACEPHRPGHLSTEREAGQPEAHLIHDAVLWAIHSGIQRREGSA